MAHTRTNNKIIIQEFITDLKKMIEPATDEAKGTEKDAGVAMITKAVKALETFLTTQEDQFKALMKMSDEVLNITQELPYPKISDLLSLQFVAKFCEFLKKINVKEYFTGLKSVAFRALHPDKKIADYLANLRNYQYFFQLVLGSQEIHNQVITHLREFNKQIREQANRIAPDDEKEVVQFVKEKMEVIVSLNLPFHHFNSGAVKAFLAGDYENLVASQARNHFYHALIETTKVVFDKIPNAENVIRNAVRECLQYSLRDVEKSPSLAQLVAQLNKTKNSLLEELTDYAKGKHDQGKKEILGALLANIKEILERDTTVERKIRCLMQELLRAYKVHNTYIMQRKIAPSESGKMFDRYLTQFSQLFFMIDEFNSDYVAAVLSKDETERDDIRKLVSFKTEAAAPSDLVKKGMFKQDAVVATVTEDPVELMRFKSFVPEIFGVQAQSVVAKMTLGS